MPFTADVISDLHANIWKMPDTQISTIFAVRSPNLILAGDIGDPDEEHLYRILSYVQPLYKRIIYIAGNHEFNVRESNSTKTPAAVLNWFKQLEAKWSNFYFFYRRSEVFDGVRIIGATAWSTAPRDGERARFVSEESRKDRDFLQAAISRAHEPTLVITHYAPSFRLLQDNFKALPGGLDYAQDLEMLFRPPVKAWICGHIHQAHMMKLNTIALICHPYGYPQDKTSIGSTRQIIVG